LDQYDALAQGGLPPADVAKAQFALLADWLTNRPEPLFSELRQAKPIFVPTLGPVLVTCFRDAIEAFGLDDVFTVKPAADAIKILVGDHPFILGMDDSAARDNDESILRLAVKRSDVDLIRAQVASECEAITGAAGGAALDIVKDYGSTVPLRLAGSYFGVPGPDVPTLRRWLRAMFRATFRNPSRNADVDAAGKTAAAEYLNYVNRLVADAHANTAAGCRPGRRRRRPPPPNTVLHRLVAMQSDPNSSFDDAALAHNLSSLLMGMIDTTNAAVNFAVDVLLDEPAHLASAAAAAAAGDDALLLRHILEALRFSPPVPLLARVSTAEVVLAKGTDRATSVPAGRLVYIAAGSAMMDEIAIDSPREFRLDRPLDNYLHLGWGLHRCFGRAIAQVLMVEMVKALVTRKNLRRAPGAAGQPAFDGPFLESFSVVFDR